MSENADWRPIIAALANDDMRKVVVEAMAGGDPDRVLAEYAPSRRRHITAGLLKSGMVTRENARLVFTKEVFARVLAQQRSAPRTGSTSSCGTAGSSSIRPIPPNARACCAPSRARH